MSFLRNSHLNLSSSHIETSRCVLVPFSLDGRVDIYELQTQYCKANRNLYVSPNLPTYEEEVDFIRKVEEKIGK